METTRKYDLIILGATGFTGQFVLEEVLRETDSGSSLRVCVAGRSRERLQAGLEAAGKLCGLAVQGVAVEVVDVTDAARLQTVAAMGRVLLSCVGPYRHYGMQVAKACVAAGTDFVDISGEPQYLEAVQAELGDLARSKGVYVVGSCGFDSVPADLGMVYLQESFPGPLCHVEMVLGHGAGTGSTSSIHATTLQCAVLGYADKASLRSNRAKILASGLTMPAYRPPKRGMLWWSNASKSWCVANIAADRSVVVRSQHLLHTMEGKPPVHFSAYFGMHSLSAALGAVLFGVVFLAMNAFSWSRNLLIAYPEIFTFGMFTWAGPTREQLKEQSFLMTLTGVGWSSEEEKEQGAKPTTVRHCRVSGPDPGYYGTALIFVQCALAVLRERHHLPAGGGVLTPAAAFRHTSLMTTLQTRGVVFTVSRD